MVSIPVYIYINLYHNFYILEDFTIFTVHLSPYIVGSLEIPPGYDVHSIVDDASIKRFELHGLSIIDLLTESNVVYRLDFRSWPSTGNAGTALPDDGGSPSALRKSAEFKSFA